MSNSAKKSLKRKQKAKQSRVKKQLKKEQKEVLFMTDKGKRLMNTLKSLDELPLTEISQPLVGVYSDSHGMFMRVLSVSDRNEIGDFTVSFCEVDAMSDLDATEAEFISAVEWAQMSAICELELLTT